MTRGVQFIVAVLVAVVGTSVGVGVGAYAVPQSAVVQSQVIDRGGVIRLGTDVYVHQNNAHASIGITSIQLVDGCQLRINFDRKPGERIVAAIAEEDETMSRLDVQAGISSGVYEANVFLYRRGTRVCADDPMFGTSSNLWVHLTYLADGGNS